MSDIAHTFKPHQNKPSNFFEDPLQSDSELKRLPLKEKTNEFINKPLQYAHQQRKSGTCKEKVKTKKVVQESNPLKAVAGGAPNTMVAAKESLVS